MITHHTFASTHHCAVQTPTWVLQGSPTYCSQEINRGYSSSLQNFSVRDPWALENSCALQSSAICHRTRPLLVQLVHRGSPGEKYRCCMSLSVGKPFDKKILFRVIDAITWGGWEE